MADRFAWLREATDAHRAQHGCWAYPYGDGALLGAIGLALRAGRVLELGTALGYTACWWAQGAARVDTVERDPLHVRLAREAALQAGAAERVQVHEGAFDDVLPSLPGPYDLVFFDGYAPPPGLLEAAAARLRPGGVLVAANLELGDADLLPTLLADPGWRAVTLDDLAVAQQRRPGT